MEKEDLENNNAEEERGLEIYDKYGMPICQCFFEKPVHEKVEVSERKEYIFNAVTRTEHYLRERRIPELIRFFFTKIISEHPNRPLAYFENLLDDCMLFRSGHGVPPVLFEDKHLEAVLKSFDPGNRGWLSAGQIRRLYTTLGITCKDVIEDRMPTDEILKNLKRTQENDLLQLLSAGSVISDKSTNGSVKSDN